MQEKFGSLDEKRDFFLAICRTQPYDAPEFFFRGIF